MIQRISDEAVLAIAISYVSSEVERQLPLGWRRSFEKALADAGNAQKLALSDFSRGGGRKRKSDTLQELIVRIVCEAPDISEKELYQKLRGAEGEGVVFSIDDDSLVLKGDRGMIHFEDHDGEKKAASVDGLKDRLSRAKKIIRANR